MRTAFLSTLGLGSLALMFAAIGANAPVAGVATDASSEISTALAHAQMAVAGQDLNTVHMHLQHVVNCLVGPNGKGFDPNAEDPCKGMGNGAISDVDPKSDLYKQLGNALDDTNEALGKTDFKKSQSDAGDVVEDLVWPSFRLKHHCSVVGVAERGIASSGKHPVITWRCDGDITLQVYDDDMPDQDMLNDLRISQPDL